MLKHRTPRKSAVAVLIAVSLGLAACSSDDDDNGGNDATPDTMVDTGDETPDEATDNMVSLDLTLDSTITVPPANVDGAGGTGSVVVDTETGAISGSVTVSGLTGPVTVAHIHQGDVGVAGPVLIDLEASEDNLTFTVPEGSALDAAQIEAFNDGLLYINIHTAANMPGEVRVQLVEAVDAAPEAGSVTFTFRNLSEFQPMTPPNVILHNGQDSASPIRFFEVGAPATGEVIQIAENGVFGPLNEVAQGQITAGTVGAAGIAFSDPANPGPLLPGGTSTLTLDSILPDQVLSVVSMVVCTNDGFSGVDSIPIEEGTTTLTIYDAGSETNVLTLDYWVPPCGTESNITDDEGGVITLHPGQSGSEIPADQTEAVFDFASGTELLEMTITINE